MPISFTAVLAGRFWPFLDIVYASHPVLSKREFSRAAGEIANPEGGEIVPSCQLYECNQWGVRKSSRDWGRNQLRGLGAQPGNANRPGNCSQFVH